MALPASGEISLNDIATEFGGTAPHAISEYYDAASGVPASGTIAFSDFHGTSAYTYSMGGDRGVFAGGSSSNVLDYINIKSTGNASDFGDLDYLTNYGMGACSDSSRAVFCLGYASVSSSDSRYQVDVHYGRTRDMHYITVGTPGDSTYFGENSNGPTHRGGLAACSNGSRGVFAGGTNSQGSNSNTKILYITIGSTGNANQWGSYSNMDKERNDHAAAGNSTRGLFGGGYWYSGEVAMVHIEYITIANTSQRSNDFGDLTTKRRFVSACASDTRAVFAGGQNDSGTAQNTIDYVSFSSTGDASDFGDLTVTTKSTAGCSNGLRGVFNLNNGNGSSLSNNTIEYITIGSTGNAADFGDRTVAQSYAGATSGS